MSVGPRFGSETHVKIIITSFIIISNYHLANALGYEALRFLMLVATEGVGLVFNL